MALERGFAGVKLVLVRPFEHAEHPREGRFLNTSVGGLCGLQCDSWGPNVVS